jgi:hypothetical protein
MDDRFAMRGLDTVADLDEQQQPITDETNADPKDTMSCGSTRRRLKLEREPPEKRGMSNSPLAPLAAVALSLCSLTVLHAEQAAPVPVFVTSLQTPLPQPMKPEEHAAAFNRTRTEMFDRGKQLRQEHGDNTKAWPRDVWKIFNEAEDAHTMTIARRNYESRDTQLALGDSVADFVRGASGLKGMTLVSNPADAAIIVEITGRRYASAGDPTDNHYFIRFRMRPGAQLTADRFLDLTWDYNWNDPWTQLYSRPREGADYYDMEAGSPASYKNCAGTVRAIVARFIRARMDPSRKK